VEVVSWDIEALGEFRCPDANHRTGGIGKLEDRLILDCISQAWIRLLLLGNTPGLDVGEGPVDPHCIESIPGGQLLIQLAGKLCEVAGISNCYVLIGFKVGHCGKGRGHIALHRIGHAVRLNLIVIPVQGDHLTIERIEGAYAEIALGLEIIECVKAIKNTL